MSNELIDPEGYFQAARKAQQESLPSDFAARLLGDALAEMPKAPAEQVVVLTKPRGVFGLRKFEWGGLFATLLLGLGLGLAGQTSTTGLGVDDFALSDFMPAVDTVLGEEVEG